MTEAYYYDVTNWPVGNPFEDVGQVINSMIEDIKKKQNNRDLDEGGKPGAVIYLPPADYHLKTQVLIDISFLKIMGSGHGFTSSSIRFNVPEEDVPNLHELWPGGSRILVDLETALDAPEIEGAAFVVKRDGDPRISSVEFNNFCIDGLHFIDDGTGEPNIENTYVNGKTGIYVASAQDSFLITDMGLVYLEHGVTIYNADALTIHNNFIAECGNCLELRGWGQASKVTNNLMGAGFKGYSIYAEHFAQLLISSNNIFPRGASTIEFNSVTRSSIVGNILHAFYAGMVMLQANSSENLVSGNHFLHDHEPWKPMQMHDNGLDDLFGLLTIEGHNNSVIGNHFSEILDREFIKPVGAKPVIIRLISGDHNYIATNNTVATEAHTESGDSAFAAQVDSLLTTEVSAPIDVTTVLVEANAVQNTILDSGTDEQVILDQKVNAFRATPSLSIR